MIRIDQQVRFYCKGLNQEYFFNKLLDKGIVLFDLKKINSLEFTFCIFLHYSRIVESMAVQNSILVLKKKKIGFFSYIKNFFLKFGILAGATVCSISFLLMENFVFRIDVFGNENITSKDIIAFLGSQNISIFSPIHNINCKETERLLIENFEEISSVSIVKKGMSLILNIKEKIAIPNQNYNDLIADFNGRIKSIKAISGTALKSAGDLVKKGDVLIQACVKNQHGEIINIEPKAEICCEIWLESEQLHHAEKYVYTETGRTQINKKISYSGITIFDNFKDVKFQNYEQAYSVKYIKNMILPLKIEYFTYKEIKKELITSCFQDVKDKILCECREIALQNAIENDIIIEERHLIDEQQFGVTSVKYLVLVERNLVYGE